mgnify:CR=1 FL=1|jgi:hypothetical protein
MKYVVRVAREKTIVMKSGQESQGPEPKGNPPRIHSAKLDVLEMALTANQFLLDRT